MEIIDEIWKGFIRIPFVYFTCNNHELASVTVKQPSGIWSHGTNCVPLRLEVSK